jgi:tripartite motif-containing protein 71
MRSTIAMASLVLTGALVCLPVVLGAGTMVPVFIASWGCKGLDRSDGVATDAQGFVYVADRYNGRIFKFDREGRQVAAWGSYGSGPGQLAEPYGITVAGNEVFVAEQGNERIQVFDLNGTHLRTWGSRGSAPGQFETPAYISVHDGEVYVTDYHNHRVQVFSTDGTFRRQWGSPGYAPGQFAGPLGIVATEGGVYVVEFSDRVQKFTLAGQYVLEWPLSGGTEPRPRGMAIDRDGRLFICKPFTHRIQIYSTAGAYLGEFGSSGTGPGQFEKPADVAIDREGNLYVADLRTGYCAVRDMHCSVQKFALDAPTVVRKTTWGALKARYRE